MGRARFSHTLFAMAQDFESLLKDVFGEPLSRLTQFQSDQLGKLTSRLQEIAREAVKEDFTKMQHEITELRTRLARIEQERAQAAADSLETSF
ncbi:MAG TPA: hypothetical protein VEK11_07330 [Thermoanaerobaculia bacterium]|nr:hypothetical protein [Thermoanaerobaculia bacterium]